jgi:hypothetical protein
MKMSSGHRVEDLQGRQALAADSRGKSLSAYLARIIWLCILPLLLLAGRLAYEKYQDREYHRELESLLLATDFAATVDDQLRARCRN